jgi:VanZ family protein
MGTVAFAAVLALSVVVLFSPGSDVPSGLPVSDKVVHFSLFLALAVTGRAAAVPAVPLGVALVAYAGVSEVLQTVLPIDRDGDLRDGLADTLGVLAGLAVVTLAARAGRERH